MGRNGANADLMLHGPAFSWFANGLHMAGTFGGLQCDGAGDIRTNGTDLLIDNAVTAAANFDYEKNGGCAFDGGYSGSNIVINDTKTGGGMPIVLNGWLGASWYASTVNIEKCQGCLIYSNGALASLSCQDGVYIQDQSVYLSINAATQLRGNGQNGDTHSGQPLGNGTCTTGTGRGWGSTQPMFSAIFTATSRPSATRLAASRTFPVTRPSGRHSRRAPAMGRS